MRRLHVLALAVLGASGLPGAALAGAPNYDCAIRDGHGRLAIDQWRPMIVSTGIGAGSTVGGDARGIEQHGPTLRLTATLAGVRWRIAIAGYGRSLILTSAGAQLVGRCTTIPGNLILRVADRGGHAVRRGPSPMAAARSAVRTGEPVWERPDASPRGRWLPVLVVVHDGPRPVVREGWLRQVGPFQARGSSSTG
jgi:hypothetical protein